MAKQLYKPSANFKNEIKALREKLNMTQQEFANKLEISVGTAQNWENGRAVPRDNAIKLIISEFNLSEEAQALLFSKVDEAAEEPSPSPSPRGEGGAAAAATDEGRNANAKASTEAAASTIPAEKPLNQSTPKKKPLHPLLKTFLISLGVWLAAWVIFFIVSSYFALFAPLNGDGESIAQYKRIFTFAIDEFLWIFFVSLFLITGIPALTHIIIVKVKNKICVILSFAALIALLTVPTFATSSLKSGVQSSEPNIRPPTDSTQTATIGWISEADGGTVGAFSL